MASAGHYNGVTTGPPTWTRTPGLRPNVKGLPAGPGAQTTERAPGPPVVGSPRTVSVPVGHARVSAGCRRVAAVCRRGGVHRRRTASPIAAASTAAVIASPTASRASPPAGASRHRAGVRARCPPAGIERHETRVRGEAQDHSLPRVIRPISRAHCRHQVGCRREDRDRHPATDERPGDRRCRQGPGDVPWIRTPPQAMAMPTRNQAIAETRPPIANACHGWSVVQAARLRATRQT